MKKTYTITPVAKPRMTGRDRWARRPEVLRYWAFKDEVLKKGLTFPWRGAHIIFNIPMPKGWSEKKKLKMDGQPHEQKRKNDLDNLMKALGDSVYGEDSYISQF